MTYADQWRALSSRIRGLMHAGELHANYLSVRSSDDYGRGNRLLEQGGSIFRALESFVSTFGTSLPEPARIAITEFVTNNRGLMTRQVTGTQDELQERAWATLVLLGAFETEITFILADVQGRRTTQYSGPAARVPAADLGVRPRGRWVIRVLRDRGTSGDK